ncbi:MAG: hypothetical protein L3J83_00660 [Proteobacteria bacterium]|nr:hypothetical protein [Pseudomonadota bacterium]
MHQNLLKYKNYRYLKLFMFLLLGSTVLYLSGGDDQPANGGTMQGYVLGITSTVFILLLTYLGIRKRSYSSTMGTLQGWASAHVFLGASLVLLATLHTAFQVGWNVHTLAYVLMLLVIFSGFYGLFAYMHYPGVMSKNNSGGSQEKWLEELQGIDEKIKNWSLSCSGKIRLMVLSAIENTVLDNTLYKQIRGKDRSRIQLDSNSKSLVLNSNQEKMIDILSEAIPNSNKQAEASALNEMLTLFSRRRRLLIIIRRNLQIKAFLKVWLLFHIPLTIALLAALIVHILVVFIYW